MNTFIHVFHTNTLVYSLYSITSLKYHLYLFGPNVIIETCLINSTCIKTLHIHYGRLSKHVFCISDL